MHCDYRFDPFTDASIETSIAGETQMIPSGSPYTIRLNEVPLKEAPSSILIRIRDALTAEISTAGTTSCLVVNGAWFAINDVINIENEQMLVTNVSSNTLTITRGYNITTAATHPAGTSVYGPAWSEVAATPAVRQYWPDYGTGADNDDTWNTGTIMFNGADANKLLDISYKGIGTLGSINPARNYQPWMSSFGDGSDGDFVSNGADIIDGVKQYKSFNILPGHIVTVGNLPLWLFCQGGVIINGILNGAGGNGESNKQYAPANGVSRGGASMGLGVNTDEIGASGGGASSSGGSFWRGMQVAASKETPPVAYQMLMALSAEPGGGCVGVSGVSNVSGQGGSGGSIIIACRRYRNSGAVSVAAGSNGAASGSYNGGGGGGGAGIKIIAPSVFIGAEGIVTAAGGDGGNGAAAITAGASAAGWTKVFETY